MRAAHHPLAAERARLRQRIREHTLRRQELAAGGGTPLAKRPAAAAAVLDRVRTRGAPVKRTVFTRERTGSLVPYVLRRVQPRFRIRTKSKDLRQ